MTLQRDSVDGVEVFFTESGRDVLSASLIFRVGWSDETLVNAGVTHLIEHLLLHGEPPGALRVNGSTASQLTSLDVSGAPDDVVAYLQVVCRRVSEFPFGDMNHERRVLAAERAERGVSAMGRALAVRFGVTGLGLAGWSDFAIENLRPESVSPWLERYFTAGNAVLTLDGPIPTGLRLPLPSGPRRPTVPPVARPFTFPTAHEGYRGVVIATGKVPDGPAVTLAGNVWRRRVRQALLGRVIGPRSQVTLASEFAGPEQILGIIVHIGDKGARETLEAIRTSLDDLAGVGPTDRELADEVTRVRLGATSADYNKAEPWLVARRSLAGLTARDGEATVAEFSAVAPSAVAAVCRQVQDTLLVQVPPGTDRSGQRDLTWTPIHDPAPDTPSRTYRLKGPSRWVDRESPVIRLGATTVSHQTPAESFTLSLPHVAAALVRRDGGTTLVSADGDTLRIEPSLWESGATLVAQVKNRLPESVVLIRESISAVNLPQPITWKQWYARRVRSWIRRPTE